MAKTMTKTPDTQNHDNIAPWDKDTVLSVEHLTMRFGGLVAVNDLSFNVGRGQITALIGPNGAGKTTVFNCVTGFYKPTEGRVAMRQGPGVTQDDIVQLTKTGKQFNKTERGGVYLLERMPDFEISEKAKVARTFQNIRLFGGMTILENLLVAQHNKLMDASLFTVGGIFGIPSFKKAEKKSIEKAVYWLEHVGLLDRADDPAADLSYGAQRRLEIARAMCTDPLLLCLDEPAAGLNPKESGELNALLQYIRKEHGTSILLIEHDMGVVMEISDHVVVLDYGQKISDGPAEFVRNDPKVIAAYLGVDDEEAADTPEADAIAEKHYARVDRSGEPMLKIRDLETYYGKIVALRGVDVDVHKGEIVTMIGANGAGKSTLMMTVFGTPRARAGQIIFEGQEITQMPIHEISHLRISQSPEGRRIFPRMTVEENLRMGSAIVSDEFYDEDLAKVFRLFPRLKERRTQRGGTLSGGEQQMLAIGRALMARPKLLLLDEPSLGLAPLIVKQIFDAIRELNVKEGLTVFLVEQNAFHALKLADRGYVMVNGKITMQGSGRELLKKEEVRAAYLEGGGH